MHRSMQSKGCSRCVGGGLPVGIVVAVLLMALCLLPAQAAGFQYYTSVDAEVSMSSVTGPGAAGSSMDQTPGYKADIRVTGYKDDDDGSQLLSFGLSVGTNLGMGTRAVALTGIRWEKAASDYKLKLGDVMEFFSQYSLSSSFKGFSYTRTLPGDAAADLIIAAGYAYPRWENVYAGVEVPAVQREVKGVRLVSGATLSDNTYGVSIVSSVDRSGINPGDKLYDNAVISLDTEFRPIPGLTVRAVAALSDTTEITGATQAGGSAVKVEASSAAKQGKATFEYERATPGFMAVMGSVKADREKVKLRITSNHTNTLTSTIGYLYTSDNLENQKAKTTISNNPEISVSIRRPFERRYASIGAALKYDFKRIGSRTVDGRTMSVDYRDRFGDLDTSLSILNDLSEDSGSTSPSKSEDMTYAVELSTREEFRLVTLRPALRSSLTTSLNHVTGTRSQTTDTAIEVRVDVPSSNINSTIRIGQQVSTGSSTSPEKIYADLSVYYRPGFLASLRDGRIFLRATHAGYQYADASKNRAETGVKTGVSLSW